MTMVWWIVEHLSNHSSSLRTVHSCVQVQLESVGKAPIIMALLQFHTVVMSLREPDLNLRIFFFRF